MPRAGRNHEEYDMKLGNIVAGTICGLITVGMIGSMWWYPTEGLAWVTIPIFAGFIAWGLHLRRNG